jgi:hypothetical protein
MLLDLRLTKFVIVRVPGAGNVENFRVQNEIAKFSAVLGV